MSRPLPTVKSARDVSAGFSRAEESLPQKCFLFSLTPCHALKPFRDSSDSMGLLSHAVSLADTGWSLCSCNMLLQMRPASHGKRNLQFVTFL